MLGEMIQKSMLEWLQLTPDLLSGIGKRAAAAKALPAPVSIPQPDVQPWDVAPITLAAVEPSTTRMGFFTPPSTNAAHLPEPWQRSMSEAYCPEVGAYSSLEAGGSQCAALAEITGYLTTRLAPAPAQTTGWTNSPALSVPPRKSIANPAG
jgi:hypothetical protein